MSALGPGPMTTPGYCYGMDTALVKTSYEFRVRDAPPRPELLRAVKSEPSSWIYAVDPAYDP